MRSLNHFVLYSVSRKATYVPLPGVIYILHLSDATYGNSYVHPLMATAVWGSVSLTCRRGESNAGSTSVIIKYEAFRF